MLTSLTYGLPTLPFVPRKGKGCNGLVHDREHIDRIFHSLNTTDAALRLLEDTGLDPDRPHHRPQSRNSNRRNIVITLCADRRGASPMHRISIVGSERGRPQRRLTALGLSAYGLQNAGSGRSWRLKPCAMILAS